MLIYGAGSTFLSAAVLGFDYNMVDGARLSLDSLPRSVSCALAVVAMACLFQRWPAVRVPLGAGFAFIAWRSWTDRAARVKTELTSPQGVGYAHRFGIATSLLATLLVANIGIWQKETLIGNGRQVFIALAPVDPRSMMQGDYMALNFQLTGLQETDSWGRQRVKAVARVDGRGIAVIHGLAA